MVTILPSTFALFLVGSAFVGRLPLSVFWIYLALSLITFFAYGLDKMAARHGSPRIRESSMLFFGLFGGWPGALAGQRVFHHKTQKSAFQLLFWVTVVINCATMLVIIVGMPIDLDHLLPSLL